MSPLIWDRSINLLKWPTAIFSLASLPAAVLCFGDQVAGAFTEQMALFWVGSCGYLVLWYAIFSKKMWGSWLPTFEHELIHAIFAWLTFHRVTDFHASWSKGGHIRYIGGEGNWLITIAPYFFPLASLLCLMTYIVNPTVFQGFFHIFMGVVVGFQGCSTWREVHRNQPDLKDVGWPFAFCFLPTANLLVYTWFLGVLQGQSTKAIWYKFYTLWKSHFDLLFQYALTI